MSNTNSIWLALDSRSFGGIETHVFNLAQGLKSAGQVVHVIFLNDYGPHPLKEQLHQQHITVTTLENGGFKTLRSALKNAPPLLLHTHGYKAGIIGRLAARSLNIPVASTFHAGEIPRGKVAFYDFLDRYTAFLAQRRFSVSADIAARIPISSEIINNFINVETLPISQGKEIAFVGRLNEEKGADYFIALARRLPELNFTLYGDGPQRDFLEHQAPDNVQFKGAQHDMQAVWPHIGLMVMPSRAEGLSMAALEAMGHGIPVLASRVGDMHRLIQDCINGWLVTPGDLDTFAQRIQQWSKLPYPLSRHLTHAARLTIEAEFSSQIIIPKLQGYYQCIV